MVLQITRILFPVDFSDRCAAIAGRVKALAEHFESEVVMIYALPRVHDGADALQGNDLF
jgi:hypothetical protein